MISIKSLGMRYGTFTALNKVSFQVEEGEILGLLGPNGAGKTTLMRVLTTYLYPTEGTAQIAGYDIIANPIEVRRQIGYLPETAPLYMDMRVDEYLEFVGRARGLSPNEMKQRIDWLLNACSLKPVWKHTLFEISRGYRQRVGLAQALIHDPKVLILDEPTSGLDPLQIIEIRDLVHSLAKKKTIIFSTHILQEVEALADRIVIINEGKIVADGTREEIAKRAIGIQRVRVAIQAEKNEVKQAIEGLNACSEIHYEGCLGSGYERFLLRADAGVPLLRMIDEMVRNRKWPLGELVEESASLEESFIALLKPAKSKVML
ncbi:MAG: MFS transporter [Omnitrophica bacterium RIFCSPLOWO2_12_FULL_44_17]|uniref:MFS transporter n=1 Tax=Candidatus Danuiimicrobium aquiferis TaxID=1801832 RepID=A0A1G1KW72_9BACT|nr:MAG: MFS transporter [Omnitrophica bacterium RIFCSPHIGHO2_02_FULL_45_28]OGW88562.1 MAG: MFS transporter [Omnitrophica bacterium RIFCSPHIGHO2_12_FULL_44_12]OGW96819.1 MAG: MFS transporter [Omnitrophica bacterium RIFCSPLOWO2_12_FULL_44_17]OGX03821.1 MAG: MFS transporter [Omnitrophica bacterium RIFCSPLOWO2_02_FULL_44_11]